MGANCDGGIVRVYGSLQAFQANASSGPLSMTSRVVLFDPTAAVDEPSILFPPCSDRDVVVPVPVVKHQVHLMFPMAPIPQQVGNSCDSYFCIESDVRREVSSRLRLVGLVIALKSKEPPFAILRRGPSGVKIPSSAYWGALPPLPLHPETWLLTPRFSLLNVNWSPRP